MIPSDPTPFCCPPPPATAALVNAFRADRDLVLRRWDVPASQDRGAALRDLYALWQGRLAGLPPTDHADEALDRILLERYLERQQEQLCREEARWAETTDWLPGAGLLMFLQTQLRVVVRPNARDAAAVLAELTPKLEAARVRLQESIQDRGAAFGAVARRVLAGLDDMVEVSHRWSTHYSAYDPQFDWWVSVPHREFHAALTAYREAAAAAVAAAQEGLVVGDPLGREALQAEIHGEGLPYTPEELLAIAEAEYAWCEAEMLRAAAEMGLPGDWRGALERVKAAHPEPGEQPGLVAELAAEAVEFLDQHDLVTVPALARIGWRLEMMTEEEQKINPFFLGGEVIKVSYPTSRMSHREKLMSLRGNNRHFSRTTVQHELIPGHFLQSYMMERNQPHRCLFSTPFWIEGWALHWEMLLWELEFPRSPEDRVGMLFWRMHRCVRITFSLGFHLGELSPRECVELLVGRVGHERANAEGEVRRSFGGGYPPLYQAAYLLGGLQFHTLYRECTGAGGLSPREFHDRVLQSGPMPMPCLRAHLLGLPLTRENLDGWRFAEPSAGGA